VRAHVVEQPEGLPLNFYWAAWPWPLQPGGEDLQECAEDVGPEVKIAIARDAEGRVLERRMPAWNGNRRETPTGPRHRASSEVSVGTLVGWPKESRRPKRSGART
jgi:hypothetical protein